MVPSPRCQRLSSTTTRIKTSVVNFLVIIDNVRDYLPLQQGLRHHLKSSLQYQMEVRDYLPLQQGLRLLKALEYRSPTGGQRLSSTTTRIKTFAAGY